jgi:hypothetical protein
VAEPAEAAAVSELAKGSGLLAPAGDLYFCDVQSQSAWRLVLSLEAAKDEDQEVSVAGKPQNDFTELKRAEKHAGNTEYLAYSAVEDAQEAQRREKSDMGGNLWTKNVSKILLA